MNPNGSPRGPQQTDPDVRRRMDEVMRHARLTFRYSASEVSGNAAELVELDGSLHGASPWPQEAVEWSTKPLWSPASWFATLGVAGAVPLVIVYWMLN